MLNTYVILLRGINVGGKNILPMADLRYFLEEIGFSNVSTYIASGNVILESDLPPDITKDQIETALPKKFQLDNSYIKALVLSENQLRSIIANKPEGFGEQPEIYHYDVFFLMDLDVSQALLVFDPREGVDRIWPSDGVIYTQRLSSQRTRSRLTKIIRTQAYKSMTIRNWNTTKQLLTMVIKMRSSGQ